MKKIMMMLIAMGISLAGLNAFAGNKGEVDCAVGNCPDQIAEQSMSKDVMGKSDERAVEINKQTECLDGKCPGQFEAQVGKDKVMGKDASSAEEDAKARMKDH